MKKLMGVLCFMLVAGCASTADTPKKEEPVKKVEKDEIYNASFLAVGDNLIHEAIYYFNQNADGSYALDDIYENTNKFTQNVDLAYINFETIAAGTELGLSGYPTFNGPFEVIDSVQKAGFDWMSGASNHCFDRGEAGIVSELNYIKSNYPQMQVTGIHASEEDAKKQTIFDVNGMKIGALTYTYGLNGFVLPEGKEYLVDLIDKDKIKKDVTKLKEVSDVQMVSMHWGQEYQFSPNAQQQELAQYLSDLGVDVIIGTHPHVIQPMDYIKGKDGNETLVMYSLGNFVSAQDENYRMLGGMAKWNISYNKTKDKVSFENVQFVPTIMQIENNFHDYRTYTLQDYNDTLASKHTLQVSKGQDMSRQYFIDLVNEVMNDKIEIVY